MSALKNGDRDEKQSKPSPDENSDLERIPDSSIAAADMSQTKQQFQIDNHKVSNNSTSNTTATNNTPTNPTASATEHNDHTATCLDINLQKDDSSRNISILPLSIRCNRSSMQLLNKKK